MLEYASINYKVYARILHAPYSVFFNQRTVLFLHRSLDLDFFFGLPMLDWIESPIATVTTHFYYDRGIYFTTDLHQSCGKVGHGIRGSPCYIPACSSRPSGLHRWPVFTVIAQG
jgi:hypothetical protein